MHSCIKMCRQLSFDEPTYVDKRCNLSSYGQKIENSKVEYFHLHFLIFHYNQSGVDLALLWGANVKGANPVCTARGTYKLQYAQKLQHGKKYPKYSNFALHFSIVNSFVCSFKRIKLLSAG